ncbi:MAG: Ig-like domain-containing protein, partial [Yersinia sp. (in: enterobacteria)]
GTTGSLVTLTLKDVNNNLVSGQIVTFDSSLANSTVGTVSDNGDGTYTASLTGTAPGAASITAQVGGNPFAVAPASVTLNAFSDVLVNGTNFGLNDGFPTTGFTGAEFTLNVTGSPTDYNWTSSNPSWVSVDSNGKVSFTAEGNSTPVTITASLKTGGGNLTYPFTVTSWFINNGNTELNFSSASSFCTTQVTQLPSRLQLVNVSTLGTIGTREAGGDVLWSEWGDLRVANYPLAGFMSNFFWTNEIESVDRYYAVRLDSGLVTARNAPALASVVCRKVL